MRNASHRSICRLRRAARRVGGRQEGVAGRDPSQGSPVPSSTPTPTPQENPQPGTPTRPQSPPVLGPATPHIPCAPSQGVHLCLGALTSLHSSVHLPRSICLSLCVCLSFSGCVACFSRVLSFHECLPISVSTCISCISLSTCLLSACSLGFLFFASPSFPFFRSICHPSVPLSFCPRGSCLSLLLSVPESSHQPQLSLSNSLPVTLTLCPLSVGTPPLSSSFPLFLCFGPCLHVLSLSPTVSTRVSILSPYFSIPVCVHLSRCPCLSISLCVSLSLLPFGSVPLPSLPRVPCLTCQLPVPLVGPISMSTRGQQVRAFQVGSLTGWLRSLPASPVA